MSYKYENFSSFDLVDLASQVEPFIQDPSNELVGGANPQTIINPATSQYETCWNQTIKVNATE